MEHLFHTQQFHYEDKKISLNLIGQENIAYTKIALEVAAEIWTNLTEKTYDFNYSLQPWRFSLFFQPNRVFIDSTYNASPQSMKLIIENTKTLQAQLYPSYKTIYVIWDMRELWEISDEAHRNIAHQITASTAIFMVGPEMYTSLRPELNSVNYAWEIYSSLSSREIWTKLHKYLWAHDNQWFLVLFKGSQNTIFMEEALSAQISSQDKKNLVRNSQDWQEKKDSFFKSL